MTIPELLVRDGRWITVDGRLISQRNNPDSPFMAKAKQVLNAVRGSGKLAIILGNTGRESDVFSPAGERIPYVKAVDVHCEAEGLTTATLHMSMVNVVTTPSEVVKSNEKGV